MLWFGRRDEKLIDARPVGEGYTVLVGARISRALTVLYFYIFYIFVIIEIGPFPRGGVWLLDFSVL